MIKKINVTLTTSKAMQRERQEKARRSFYSDEISPDAPLPWKWDNLGIVKEIFHKPPDVEKSCEVDTSKDCYKVNAKRSFS